MVLCGVGFSEAWQGVQGAKNGPWRESPARGPARPWRTLTWLFLAGLRPRRARLRFTRQRHSRVEGAHETPSDKSAEDRYGSSAVASALLPEKKGLSWAQGQSECPHGLGLRCRTSF
jgi:hypothetical protein